MLLLERKKQKFRGEIFLLFTFAYGCRYLLEILRGDDQRGGLGLSMPTYHLVPGGLVVFAIAFTIGFSRLIRSDTARRVAQIASFLPAVIFLVAMRPASFAQPEMDAYSTPARRDGDRARERDRLLRALELGAGAPGSGHGVEPAAARSARSGAGEGRREGHERRRRRRDGRRCAREEDGDEAGEEGEGGGWKPAVEEATGDEAAENEGALEPKDA